MGSSHPFPLRSSLLDFRNFRVLKDLPFHFQNFVDIPIARETCKTFNKVKTHAILLITAKKLDKGRDLKDAKKKKKNENRPFPNHRSIK